MWECLFLHTDRHLTTIALAWQYYYAAKVLIASYSICQITDMLAISRLMQASPSLPTPGSQSFSRPLPRLSCLPKNVSLLPSKDPEKAQRTPHPVH